MNNSGKEYKFTDKNHPPVPQLKVGDRCYTFCDWDCYNYSHISTCEVRKIVVRWIEPDNQLGRVGHWSVAYYIRTDVDSPGLKTTKIYPYYLNDEGLSRIYLTPQEVMNENIRIFKERVFNQLASMRGTMKKLGYSEEQMSKLLENK